MTELRESTTPADAPATGWRGWIAPSPRPPIEDPERTEAPPRPRPLDWVRGFFNLAGFSSSLLLLRELREIRGLADSESVTAAMIVHAIVTGAAAAGFFRTARLLKEGKRSGGVMAVAGCILLIANSLSPVVDSVPVVLGVAGIAVVAWFWKDME